MTSIEEARWLVTDLARDRTENDLAWGDFALLYRKHAIGDALEARLVEAGIPCQLAEGRALADDPAVQYLIAALRVIERPGDPILEEQFARVVLPRTLYDTLRADAEQNRTELVDWLRQVGRQSGRDEDGKKVNRLSLHPGQPPGLRRPAWRICAGWSPSCSRRGSASTGPFSKTTPMRSPILRDHPGVRPGDPSRTDPLRSGTVWLPRMGGVELGLAGLLREAGLTMVEYLDPGSNPRPEDVVLLCGETRRFAWSSSRRCSWSPRRRSRDAFRDFVSVDVETTDNDVGPL